MVRRRKPVKRRTPRYLKVVRRADGRLAYKWEPGPTLRKRGWQSVTWDGVTLAEATALAEQQNARLDTWRAGLSGGAPSNMPTALPVGGAQATFGDLIDYFERDILNRRATAADPGLSTKTRADYRSSLRWLRAWGGDMLIRHITRDVVEELRDTLLNTHGAEGARPHAARSKLRVLSLLFTFGINMRLVAPTADPTKRLKVRALRPRTKRITRSMLDCLVRAADDIGEGGMALAMLTGFFTMQRQSDLRSATRLHWREATAISDDDRHTLSGGDGRAMTLRIYQKKTGTWVSCPVDAVLRDRVDAAFAANAALAGTTQDAPPLLVDDRMGSAFPARRFNRRWQQVLAQARHVAGDDRETLDALDGLQFRDLRRSGMCWLRDMGATIAQIAARSGHSIEETTKILETYMPADEGGSASGMSTALRNEAAAARRTRMGQRGGAKVGQPTST